MTGLARKICRSRQNRRTEVRWLCCYPMARPPKEAASPSTLAPALLRMIAERGADAALLATQNGLDLTAAEADEVAVTPSTLASMIRGTCEMLADPHGGLRL